MKHLTVALAVLTLALFAASTAVAGSGPNQPADCPDHDGDGICNGMDPDYVPGDSCLSADCPNPDCPDADGDGICNGQDPDYVPGGDGPKRFGRLEALAIKAIGIIALLGPVF